MRALLSVWDKTGLVQFASGLHANGVELVASELLDLVASSRQPDRLDPQPKRVAEDNRRRLGVGHGV